MFNSIQISIFWDSVQQLRIDKKNTILSLVQQREKEREGERERGGERKWEREWERDRDRDRDKERQIKENYHNELKNLISDIGARSNKKRGKGFIKKNQLQDI